MHIEIERMLFGDYRVQVWDKNLDSRLDREYFCRGYNSALLTAFNIRSLDTFKELDIYSRELDNLELVHKFSSEATPNSD